MLSSEMLVNLTKLVCAIQQNPFRATDLLTVYASTFHPFLTQLKVQNVPRRKRRVWTMLKQKQLALPPLIDQCANRR
jgi:hypothetical protein